MRPHISFARYVCFLPVTDHGLPFDGDLAYNDRQELPLLPESVGRGIRSPESKAEMEPPRPQDVRSKSRDSSSSPSVSTVETRQQRLDRIRREIEAGTYETPDKLEAAIERMLGTLVE